jgi:hypothetical protein
VTNSGVVLEPRLVGKISGEFLVPSYQRGYRWGRHEVEQLLNDIRDSVGDYYLQPVVVRAGDKLELIDGQQRLTTLFRTLKYIEKKHLPSAEVGYTLDYETRPLSRAFLEDPNPAMAEDNIDFFHMAQAETCIEEWFENQDEPETALDFYLNGLKKRVYVIWYEVADDVDARDLFTRLNIGRIPLTDAELVKAVLLSNVTRPEEVAAQWDGIERDLRHDDVWAFVAPRGQDASTRISLLLDTLAGGQLGPGRSSFATFEQLNEKLSKPSAAEVTAAADELWSEVVALHARVMSWYENTKLYHRIGFLVADGFNLDKLVVPASMLGHKAFEAHLVDLIRQRLNMTAGDVADLAYGGKGSDDCGRVLLLMNAEAMLLRTDSRDRYSFKAQTDDTWTLEHIEPQAEKPLRTTEQRKAWLYSHRRALSVLPTDDPVIVTKLLEEIDAVGDEITGALFTSLEEKITPYFRGADASDGDYVDSISNLALLGSRANSAFNNSHFEVKRQRMLELDKKGDFIPPCTRNVFLKYFTGADAQQAHFWSPQDRDAYLEAILAYVSPYLLPEDTDQPEPADDEDAT